MCMQHDLGEAYQSGPKITIKKLICHRRLDLEIGVVTLQKEEARDCCITLYCWVRETVVCRHA